MSKWSTYQLRDRGPWVIDDQDGNRIAETYDGDAARLIAAAPELLEALRLWLGHEGVLLMGEQAPIDAHRALVARIEGGK